MVGQSVKHGLQSIRWKPVCATVCLYVLEARYSVLFQDRARLTPGMKNHIGLLRGLVLNVLITERLIPIGQSKRQLTAIENPGL
jgi:hypothetical protein